MNIYKNNSQDIILCNIIKKMPTIIHIHGGHTRKTSEDYINYLQNKEIDIFHSRPDKRTKKYEEIFPSTTSLRPEMPSKDDAKYSNRKIRFEKYLDQLEGELILIGHSLGANFLAKRLAENQIEQWWCTIKQLHLVAGCFARNGNFTMEHFPGLIESQASDIHIYHSTDDPEVPFEMSQKYINNLPTATFHQFEDRGHFLQPDFPELRAEIQKGL